MGAPTRMWCFVLALLTSASSRAAEPLTREDVAAMLEAQRTAIVAEVRAELCRDLAGQGVSLHSCATPREPPMSPKAVPSKPVDFGVDSARLLSADKQQAPTLFLGSAGDATVDRDVGSALDRFELTTSTASSKAALRLSHVLSTPGGGGKDSFTAASFTLASPLDKEADDTTIATFDGFANASDLTFTLTNFVVSGRTSPFGPDGKPIPAFAAMLRDIGLSPDATQDLGGIYEQLQKRGELHRYPAFASMFWRGDAREWTRGFSARIGDEEFAYFDPATLAKREEGTTPWSVGVFAGYVPPRGNLYVQAGLDFERSYEGGKSRTICPVPGDQPVECTTGRFGPPAEVERHIASFELRSAVAGKAFSLELSHDFKNDESAVDLPIYLFRDEDGLLSGGVRVGWTDSDAFTFGLFVGGAFDLVP